MELFLYSKNVSFDKTFAPVQFHIFRIVIDME